MPPTPYFAGTGLYLVGVHIEPGVYETPGVDPVPIFDDDVPGEFTWLWDSRPFWATCTPNFALSRAPYANLIDDGFQRVMILPTDYAFWTYNYLTWVKVAEPFENVYVRRHNNTWMSLWTWPARTMIRRNDGDAGGPHYTDWIYQTFTNTEEPAGDVPAYSHDVNVYHGGRWEPLIYGVRHNQRDMGVANVGSRGLGGKHTWQVDVDTAGSLDYEGPGSEAGAYVQYTADYVGGYSLTNYVQKWFFITVDLDLIRWLVDRFGGAGQDTTVFLDFVFNGYAYHTGTGLTSMSLGTKYYRITEAECPTALYTPGHFPGFNQSPNEEFYYTPFQFREITDAGEPGALYLAQGTVPDTSAQETAYTPKLEVQRILLSPDILADTERSHIEYMVDTDPIAVDGIQYPVGEGWLPEHTTTGIIEFVLQEIQCVLDDNTGYLETVGLTGTTASYADRPTWPV